MSVNPAILVSILLNLRITQVDVLLTFLLIANSDAVSCDEWLFNCFSRTQCSGTLCLLITYRAVPLFSRMFSNVTCHHFNDFLSAQSYPSITKLSRLVAAYDKYHCSKTSHSFHVTKSWRMSCSLVKCKTLCLARSLNNCSAESFIVKQRRESRQS